MRRGAAQRRVDLLQVPLRVLLAGRIPRHLLAEHDLALDDGCDLPVARPEVEADPTAVEVPAQRRGPVRRQREVRPGRRDDLERGPIDVRAHEAGVEAARRARRVVAAQGIG